MNPAVPLLAFGGAVLVAAAMRRGRSRSPAAQACDWAIPTSIPPDVVARANEILASGADYGTTLDETWDGRLYRFHVETHGPNAGNPQPHKGVGVHVCVSTAVPGDGGP
jgi:hypothetical protein